jgi:hypothetical protein
MRAEGIMYTYRNKTLSLSGLALAVTHLRQSQGGISLIPSAIALEKLDTFCPGEDVPMPAECSLDL